MKNNNVISRPTNSIFDAFFQPFFVDDEKVKKSVQNFHLKYNISESTDNFTIDLAVPGLKKKEIKLDVTGDTLTVSHTLKATEKQEDEEKSCANHTKYLKRTFDYSGFEKSFKLPKNIDSDTISAQYNAGILSIVLPKKEHIKKEIKIS